MRVLPDYATNGLGQVAATVYALSGFRVNYYDMFKGSQLGSNRLYGTLLATTFSGNNRVIQRTSVAGLTTTNIYTANGFLARTIDTQIGRTNSFGYTTGGLIGAYTNELGLSVAATWDNLLRLTSIQFPDGTSISNIYNKLDLGGERDRLTNWTYYGHDGAQHLTAVTNANNAIWQFSWCGCGALTEIQDPLTNLTSFNYDNAGNLTNIACPDGSSVNYQYDLAARPTTVFDGAGHTTLLGYDNQGLVTSLNNALGGVYSAIFDLRDRRISVTDANGVTVTNQYDLINELIQRTWSDQISETFGYATNGLIAYTNRDGNATRYARDVASRLTAATNANKEVTRYTYNPANQIISLTDGNTNQTRWQYNEYGWLTNKLDGRGSNVFRYAYNANGWVTSRSTPEKGNTGYTYDNVGNLKTITYPAPQASISYGYDALNRLTSMVDALTNHVFTWTPSGQLASESDAWTTNSWTYVQGIRTQMNIVGTNWTQTYGYDPGLRLTNTVSPAGTFAYQYLTATFTLPSAISLPNGAGIANNYDALARFTGTALTNQWGHVLDGYGYLTDPLGLRKTIVRNWGLSQSTVNLSYDGIGQLTSWSGSESNGTPRWNEQLAFGYDPAHNLHSRTNGGLAQTFTTDAANQLNTVARSGTFTMSGALPAPATIMTVNSLPAQTNADFTFARNNLTLLDGVNTFTNFAVNQYGVTVSNVLTVNLPQTITLAYDNNGNLTNDGTRCFVYDAENQLTNVYVPNAWKSEFVYDGLDRRRIERDYKWTGVWVKTNEVHFIYDGLTLVQERNTNNKVLVTYTRGLDLSASLSGAGGIGGLLARTDTNGTTYYHADGNGNITALMDGGENIVARYLYNLYGKLIGQWGTMAGVNEMQFSSMPHHNLSGLTLYTYRAFDPNLQRWLNQDPVEERGGINLYRYVCNNPVSRIDQLGLVTDVDNDNMQGLTPEGVQSVAAAANAGLAYLAGHIQPGNGIAGAEEAPLMSMLQDELDSVWSRTVDVIAKSSQGKLNQRLGQSGENVTCPVKNTERIPSLTGTAKYRTPDKLDHVNGIIGDTKNVAYQALTDQLRDDQYYAIVNGYDFELTVRPDTILSSSVVNAVPRITIKMDPKLP